MMQSKTFNKFGTGASTSYVMIFYAIFVNSKSTEKNENLNNT